MAWRVADEQEAPWLRICNGAELCEHPDCHHLVQMRAALLQQEHHHLLAAIERLTQSRQYGARATRGGEGGGVARVGAAPSKQGHACPCKLAHGEALARGKLLLPPTDYLPLPSDVPPIVTPECRGARYVGRRHKRYNLDESCKAAPLVGRHVLQTDCDTAYQSLAQLMKDMAMDMRDGNERLHKTSVGLPAIGSMNEQSRPHVGINDKRVVDGPLINKCCSGFLPTLKNQPRVRPQFVHNKRDYAEPLNCKKMNVANAVHFNVKSHPKARGYSGYRFSCTKQTDVSNVKSSHNDILIQVSSKPRLSHWDRNADKAGDTLLEAIRISSSLNTIPHNLEEKNHRICENNSQLSECSKSKRKIVIQMPIVPTWTPLTIHNPQDQPTDVD